MDEIQFKLINDSTGFDYIYGAENAVTARTIIFGDIHGCNLSLRHLLEQIQPNPSKDQVIFLGDLFDRGPDSWDVLRTVQELFEAFQERFVLLLGNHEDYLLQPKLTLREKMIWEAVGRQATVRSFQKAGKNMEDAIPWLKEHVQLYLKTAGFQCVHAGILVDPPEINDRETLVYDHHIVLKNQYHGPLTITGHIALEQAAWFAGDGGTVEIIKDGRNQTLPAKGVLCIDTGCGKGGRLTAMIIEGKTYHLISTAEGQ